MILCKRQVCTKRKKREKDRKKKRQRETENRRKRKLLGPSKCFESD